MKIYTGYYANMKAYKNLFCVAISVRVPRWIFPALPVLRELAPEPHTLKWDSEPYTKAYNQRIARLSPDAIISKLKLISQGKDIILLCYERPTDFCHRQLVAKWLNQTYDIDVQEYYKEEKKAEALVPKTEQNELF